MLSVPYNFHHIRLIVLSRKESILPKEKQPSNEVSLKAAIYASGISVTCKSRAIAAIDRLLGGLVDLPSAYIEAVVDKVRAKSDQTVKMIVAEGDAQVQEFDQQVASGISQNFATRALKKALNKRKVTEHAIALLRDEPPQEDTSTIPEVDEDWLNYFEEYAEKASSEQIQIFWARILAGEIRKPKSFSLSTLRFLSEVDQECAQKFTRESKYWLEGGFILKPKKMEGQNLLDLISLEEVGLLQDVNGVLKISKMPDSYGYVYFLEGQYMLRCKTNAEVSYNVIRITRIGREILKILPPRENVAVLERVFESMSDKITSAEINLVTKLTDSKVYSKPIKVLKEEAIN